MEKLTKEASQTLPQKTSTDLRNVTFSQASADGLTDSDWLASPTRSTSGQDPALVSHSVSLAKAKELTTRDTFGPLFGGSSPSAALQECLASRLRARMDVNGSPEYTLTWKQWDMFAGLRICALRASGRPISDKDCGGWPTASQRDFKDTPGMSETGINPDGSERSRLDQLPWVAQLTGPGRSGGRAETESGGECLGGWVTPRANAFKSRPNKKGGITPDEQAQMAGYPTPQEDNANNSMGHKGTAFSDLPTTAQTMLPDMTGWKLNPRFSLWIMGYPVEWASCGELAMQSCRKSPRRSSRRQPKQ